MRPVQNRDFVHLSFNVEGPNRTLKKCARMSKSRGAKREFDAQLELHKVVTSWLLWKNLALLERVITWRAKEVVRIHSRKSCVQQREGGDSSGVRCPGDETASSYHSMGAFEVR